jgi:site-specific DNA-methyltransferase (adenine-specific)
MKFINQIVQGDCAKILAQLPDRSIDFILTDPPYLCSYRDRSGRTLKNDTSNEWLFPAFSEIHRVLKPDSFMVSFYGWPMAEKFIRAWKACGFRPIGHLVWIKNYASKTDYLRYCHEQAYLLSKGWPVRPDKPISDVMPFKFVGNRAHPTQKGYEMLLPLIRSFSKRGDIVLDPFAGSGSTCLAAKLLKRNFIGIELDFTYCRAAQRRLDYFSSNNQSYAHQ